MYRNILTCLVILFVLASCSEEAKRDKVIQEIRDNAEKWKADDLDEKEEKSRDEKITKAVESLKGWKNKRESLDFDIKNLEKLLIAFDSSAHSVKNSKEVTTITAAYDTFNHFIEIQGVASSDLNVSISPDMGGEVLDIFVDEGELVKKGQALVQLDDELVRQEIEDLKISLELATTVYERQSNLWSKNIGSEIQYLEAKNKKESLEKKLSKLQTNLNKLRITAPVSGYAENIMIKEGEMAQPGRPILNVVNLNTINVKADASESHITAVKKGELVTVKFPALGIERKAKITSVGNIINPANRTFNVEVEISNKDHILKANLLGVISINDYQNNHVIVVPTGLIQHDYDHEFLYTIEQTETGKRAKKVIIETGKSHGGRTEVLSGIENGAVIIDLGSKDLSDRALVMVKNDNGK